MDARLLERKILSLERRIERVMDRKERDVLVLYLNSLRALREARRVASLYGFLFGKEEAERLPPLPSEEEVRKRAEDPEVWERIERLRMERDRYRNDAYRYETRWKKTKRKQKGRGELKRKALLSRYMFHLRRRELYLLYVEIVGREGGER